MCGVASEDEVKINEQEFLATHPDCWTAQRAPEFVVVNIHMAEIPAPCERVFPELAAPDLLLPSKGWQWLFGFRLWLGKIFHWDREMKAHGPEPFEVGRHYRFFRIDYVDAPHEVGMSIKNALTDALLIWVLEANGTGGTRLYNVTCANFLGLRGRMYWGVIRPFHDGIIEDSLEALRRRVCRAS